MKPTKRTNTNFAGQTVVPIRAGFDEGDVLPNCLTFVRTRQIAIRVAEARESELTHVRNCGACAARLRAFQRDLGTAPEETVHAKLAEVIPPVEEHHDRHHVTAIITMLATNLFTSMRVAYAEIREDAAELWRRTHDLLHTLRYAKAHGVHAPTVLLGCGVAMSHAAATHAVHSSSIDHVHALAECLEEGAGAVSSSSSLVHGYSKLFAQVAIEGPPIVRHTLLWSLWNLFGHGHEARHVASSALERLVRSRHAPEVTPAAALIWQLQVHGKPPSHCASPELPVLLNRIEQTREIIVRLFTRGYSTDALIERFGHLLSRTFDHHSARVQILGLLVARTALHRALHEAAACGVSNRVVQECLSRLLFRHHEEGARPMLIDSELAATAADSFPQAYAHALLEAVRPHAQASSEPNRNERHVYILSAVKAYNRGVMSGAPAGRFHHDDGQWTFSAGGKHGLDHFFHELAVIANCNPSYAFHLEWANARFVAPRSRRGKVSRERDRSRRARGRTHTAGDVCL